MARVLTNEKNYYDIANTIRQMKNVNTTYKPREMASALKDIYSNEVEGVLPLSFESNGMPLIDYRIDGASGGVGDKTNNLFDGIFLHRSVIGNEVGTDDVNRRSIAIDISNYNNGEKITFSRETALGSVFQMYQISSIKTGGKLNNENVISGNSNTLLATITINNVNKYPYLMIFLNGANNPIKDEELIASKIMINVGDTALPYEPYGYKVPVVANGKNLLNTKLSTIQLGAGITFQKNNDGTVVINGTPSSNFSLLAFPVYLPATRYVFSGCPESQDSTKLRCDLRDSQYATVGGFDIGNGVIISVKSPGNYFFGIRVGAGYNCNNLKFYPMIRLATIEDDTYKPYHEPTTTNIYLDEPIEENESISLSDTNVDISTIEGTNVLTIDTTVQPSNVYIQARKDPDEIVNLIEFMEEEI